MVFSHSYRPKRRIKGRQEYIGEEDLPAEQYSAKKNPWFLAAHVHKRRALSLEA